MAGRPFEYPATPTERAILPLLFTCELPAAGSPDPSLNHAGVFRRVRPGHQRRRRPACKCWPGRIWCKAPAAASALELAVHPYAEACEQATSAFSIARRRDSGCSPDDQRSWQSTESGWHAVRVEADKASAEGSAAYELTVEYSGTPEPVVMKSINDTCPWSGKPVSPNALTKHGARSWAFARRASRSVRKAVAHFAQSASPAIVTRSFNNARTGANTERDRPDPSRRAEPGRQAALQPGDAQRRAGLRGAAADRSGRGDE